MKITIENNKLVQFTPETDAEKQALGGLWNVVVDCVKFNKKLVAVGEYTAGQTEQARFAIEE